MPTRCSPRGGGRCVSITTITTPRSPPGSASASQPDLFRKATSTIDPSPISTPPTSPATTSAVSSPASAAGPTPSGSPAGRTTNRSGPDPARVSRFRARDSEKAMPTSDTSGPLFNASSPSAALQWSLENRLRARMGANGLLLYALTWKSTDMPAGPPICALRASARRTSGSGFIGWPTPRVLNLSGSAKRRKQGQNLGLEEATQLAGWPTATSMDSRRGVKDARPWDTGRPLNQIAALAGWPTPNTSTGGSEDPEAKARRGLNPGLEPADAAALAGWATPRSVESGHSRGNPERMLNNKSRIEDQVHLAAPARLTSEGILLTGSSAAMASGGQLNPAHSRWLQGYPPAWCDCAVTAMRSTRTSRRSS